MGTSPHDSSGHAPRPALPPHIPLHHAATTAAVDAHRASLPVAATPSPPSPEFWARFAQAADARRALRFDDFMRLALYDPQAGYYTRARRRIGRGGRGDHQSDFFTATTVGDARGTAAAGANLFGELIVQSCLALAGEAFCAEATFVEIGAEPESSLGDNKNAEAHGGPASRAASCGVLRGLSELPFAAAKTISIGEDLSRLACLAAPTAPAKSARADPSQPVGLPPPLIIFSNELFDAQPCRRFVWREHAWRETWVQGTDDGALVEVEYALEHPPEFLPETAPEGYRIDAPLAARQLLDQIVGHSADWRGLFLAFDYGKPWNELCEATPQGTARAYAQHRQSNALLDCPGEQDLTCHVCWDWLQDALARSGFTRIALDSQEAFFVTHAGDFIAQTIAADARQLSARKQALMQLLHPAHMGQKFQALSALRGVPPAQR